MSLGVEVGLGPGHIVLDGNPASSPMGHSPSRLSFWPMSVVAKWLEGSRCYLVGREVGVSPSDIVLDGNPAPSPPKWAQQPPPHFSAHVYCGQMAGWIKMPPGAEVGLSPGDILIDGDPAPPKKGHSPPLFGACLLWPNSWIVQDATWYGGRPRPRAHCVRWGPSSPPQKKGHSSSPLFVPCLLWPRSLISATAELLLQYALSHCQDTVQNISFFHAHCCFLLSPVICITSRELHCNFNVLFVLHMEL